MKKSLLVLAALSLAACSHSVYLPGSHRQRPDVAGKGGGVELGFGVQQLVSVEVFDDITTNPPTRTDGMGVELVELVFPVLPFFDINIGAMEKLDFYYTSGLGLRYLWLGEPGKEGWKSTVWGGAHYSGNEKSYDEGTSTATTEVDGMEYGLSFGKDFGQHRLLYVTVGRTAGKAKTKIVQTANTFNYSDDFEHTIATLGASLGQQWYFWAEMSATQTKWMTDDAGSNTQDNTSFLIGTGYRW